MNGRKSLMLVSALTLASLLLGGGALNALAERGGGGNGDHHGVGQGTSQHSQQQKPAVIDQTGHNGESPAVHQATPAQTNTQHTDQANRHDDANAQTRDDENDNNVQRQDDDTEDLVTPPARVTGEDRPGLGCGDDNHTHTGAPGNPDNTCKLHDDAADSDQELTTNDTKAVGAVAAVDDRDGD